MRLIDADKLKEAFTECENNKGYLIGDPCEIIDNAPTVEYPFYQEAYQTGYEEGKNERPQGELIDRQDVIDQLKKAEDVFKKNGITLEAIFIHYVMELVEMVNPSKEVNK